MIALRIAFQSGSLHAAPWEHDAKGGEIEWPPSPFRILTALIEGWARAGGADLERFARVIEILAMAPEFRLPLAMSGSSRHWLRSVEDAHDSTDTMLVDSILAIDRTRIVSAYVIWRDAALSESDRAMLSSACRLIDTLGTAMQIEMSIADHDPQDAGLYTVSLAESIPGSGIAVERYGIASSMRGQRLVHELDQVRCRQPFPRFSGDAARFNYRFPPDAGLVPGPRTADEDATTMPRTTLRFKVSSERGGSLPLTKALGFAEAMRGATLARYSRLQGRPASKRLAGKDGDGSMGTGHGHPYFLPADSNGSGRIDIIDVHLPQGCTHAEFLALTGISSVYDNVSFSGRFDVRFIGFGALVSSRRWVTATPVVLDRFPKRRGPGKSIEVDGAAEQISLGLRRQGATPISIDIWAAGRCVEFGNGMRAKIESFQRVRSRERGLRPAIGASIELADATVGPLVLGRLAHFGLGRFEPVGP